ncbi:TraR/DksA C4-type zinc finger protein [Pseudomonas sp. PH1b]|uniref:TraR/DksA C4-type zinc finger protein n=1 Tax=Pseudomonas sp. PH1b TaxID=1397282 RepID=UPI003529B20B
MALAARPIAKPGQCLLKCVDCGDDILDARRLAMLDRGCTRCTGCEELADRRLGVRV